MAGCIIESGGGVGPGPEPLAACIIEHLALPWHPLPLLLTPASPPPSPPAVSVGVLQGPVPLAGCIIEFGGGVGTWVTRTYTVIRGRGAAMDGKPLGVSNTESLNKALLVRAVALEKGAGLHSRARYGEGWRATGSEQHGKPE